MSDFVISLNRLEFERDGYLIMEGVLKIGGFIEKFESPVSYWSREKYLNQWNDGVARILSGCDKSAIVTTMHDPVTANLLFWWVMYSVGDKVYMQNHVVILDFLVEPFDENRLYDFIPDRETINEDGEKISEWVLDRDDFNNFNVEFYI